MLSERTKAHHEGIIDKSTGVLIGDPETVTIRETPVPDSSQNPIGLFAEDAFAIGGRTRITLGARYRVYIPRNDTLIKPTSLIVMRFSGRREADTVISWSFVSGGVFYDCEGHRYNLTAARSFRSPNRGAIPLRRAGREADSRRPRYRPGEGNPR